MKVDKETCLSVEESKPMISDRKGSLKVTITPAQPKTLTHLPKRPPVDLAFTDLTYKVQEGRKSSKYTTEIYPLIHFLIRIYLYLN